MGRVTVCVLTLVIVVILVGVEEMESLPVPGVSCSEGRDRTPEVSVFSSGRLFEIIEFDSS